MMSDFQSLSVSSISAGRRVRNRLAIALICLAARAGFRALNRLPRTFEAGCETCTWTGPCKVYETAEV